MTELSSRKPYYNLLAQPKNTKAKSQLHVASLREQVYQYLSNLIHSGELLPGTSTYLDRLNKELGISKTALKEAIIKLECEGFVEILPHRRILVRSLSYQEIKDYYEIIGSLESSMFLSVFDQFNQSLTAEMKLSNREHEEALEHEEYNRYCQLNLAFHDIFLKLSPNMTLRNYIFPLKQRYMTSLDGGTGMNGNTSTRKSIESS